MKHVMDKYITKISQLQTEIDRIRAKNNTMKTRIAKLEEVVLWYADMDGYVANDTVKELNIIRKGGVK